MSIMDFTAIVMLADPAWRREWLRFDLSVDPETIEMVLLSDGWHDVSGGDSFAVVPSTFAGDSEIGFRFVESVEDPEAPGGSWLVIVAGPLSSILAVRTGIGTAVEAVSQ
jgi:hypothetical protein